MRHDSAGLSINSVELADLEDAYHLLPDRALQGEPFGNYMWRSPATHAQGPANGSSDIFSFGIVCVFAVTREVIFGVGESQLEKGVDVIAVVIERQLPYFASKNGLDGLFEFLREGHSWIEIFKLLEDGFDEKNRKQPFALWQHARLDDDFKDLIGGLTSFDPNERLTAQEALEHWWFRDA